MPNSYFQFKKFRIEQGDAAMKVTTEGCIFGGLISIDSDAGYGLDIGAGTGLLSLMVAQNHPHLFIDAVEIEANVFQQCQSNFSYSPWSDRMKVFNTPIQEFHSDRRYDVIFSNPPFFKESLKGRKEGDLLAKHDAGLTQQDLIESVLKLLSEDGCFWVLYPQREADQFQELAMANGLYAHREWVVRNQTEGAVFRIIRSYSKKKLPGRSEEFTIKSGGAYTSQFVSLLGDFYLAL